MGLFSKTKKSFIGAVAKVHSSARKHVDEEQEAWEQARASQPPAPDPSSRVSIPNANIEEDESSWGREYDRQREQWEAECRERERAMAEGKVLRARALYDAGVDLEQFSEGRVVDDIMNAIEFFAPQAINLAIDFSDARVSLDVQNLTKAGKVPKNVVIGRLSVEERGIQYPNDSIIGEVKYMADGSINMIDLHIWHNNLKHSVSIRTVDGMHQITSIEYFDMPRDFRKLLYSEKAPTSSSDSMAILNESLKRTME